MDRLTSQASTLAAMIGIFCRSKHRTSPERCPDCSELLHYAQERLRRCRYGNRKTACRKCTMHCYDPQHRDRIRAVMRFAGPRLLLRRPLAVFRHLFGF